MYFMSVPLQTELLPSILRRVPRQPGVSWYSPWVCGRGWRGGRGHDPSSSPVQPGQLGGSGLHVELGATSSIQSGRAYSAGEGGGCRLVEGGLLQKLKHTNFFFSTERKGMNGGHWEGKAPVRCLQMWLDCLATKLCATEACWHHPVCYQCTHSTSELLMSVLTRC